MEPSPRTYGPILRHSALIYPFHKTLPEEKISTTDPALRPENVGSVITRFGCRNLVRMSRLAVADVLFLYHQFYLVLKEGSIRLLWALLYLFS